MSDSHQQHRSREGAVRTLQLDPDLDLTVGVAGHGRPVLVLHGGAGPGSVTPVSDRLADGYQTVTPTHPGWENTPRPGRLRHVGDLASVYTQLLDVLDLHDVAVIASSFGGWVAAELALADHARRITRLVLLDAVGLPAAPRHRPPPPTQPVGGPTPAELELLVSYTGPSFSAPDLAARLADITIPTLVVWGEDDPVLTPAYGQGWADAIRDATFTVIPGAGHLPTSEAPEPTFAALTAFLTS